MKYAKAYVAVVLTVLTNVQVALDHGPVSQTQWITLGIGALVTLGGVWAVPNSVVAKAEEVVHNMTPPVPEPVEAALGSKITPTVLERPTTSNPLVFTPNPDPSAAMSALTKP